MRRYWLALALIAALIGITVSRTLLASTKNEERHAISWVFAERNPAVLGFYDSIITSYHADHPGVSIQTRYIARMSQRLPTIVASPNKPDIMFSQGGAMLGELYEMGAVRDLTDKLPPEFLAQFTPEALANFTYKGRIIGIPAYVTRVDFYYNRRIFAEAGIDPGEVRSWPEFLAVVRRLRAAGYVPIAAGPADPWTTGTYFGLLAMRTCGRARFDAVLAHKGKGYLEPCMIEAARRISELGASGAFQPGFAVAKYPQAIGMFGDGKAAMVHSYSAAVYNDQARNAADEIGLPEQDIGLLTLPGDPGIADIAPEDGFGGVGGWAVMEGAADEAIDFLQYLTNEPNQRKLAALNLNIPANINAQKAVSSPLTREVVRAISKSGWMQMYIENMQNPAVGQVMQNVVVDLMSGAVTPEAAMAKMQSVATL